MQVSYSLTAPAMNSQEVLVVECCFNIRMLQC